jgi:hypothetical protein
MSKFDVGNYLMECSQRREQLGLNDLQLTLGSTSLDNRDATLARTHMYHMVDAPTGDMLEIRCGELLAETDGWVELLVEMITNLPLSTIVGRVFLRVLSVRMPDHPICGLKPENLSIVQRAYDALDDGQKIKLGVRPEYKIASSLEGFLISTEHPTDHWSPCRMTSRDANSIFLDVERKSAIFSEKRIVLPPTIILASGS